MKKIAKKRKFKHRYSGRIFQCLNNDGLYTSPYHLDIYTLQEAINATVLTEIK